MVYSFHIINSRRPYTNMVPEITSKYYHMNVILCLLTVELDAAISVPQRVLGDALIRSEVCWNDGTDRQFHVYFVGVV